MNRAESGHCLNFFFQVPIKNVVQFSADIRRLYFWRRRANPNQDVLTFALVSQAKSSLACSCDNYEDRGRTIHSLFLV